MFRWLPLALCTLAAPVQGGQSAPALLAAVAANGRFPQPTSASLRLERQRGDATVADTAVLVGNGQTIYVETASGTRALLRPGKIAVLSGSHVRRAPTGARLGATDLLLEDLVPVTGATLAVPQVSDEGPTGTVVTGAPRGPSARALVVLTIDPERRVVTRTKYYEGSISDLAAFRRDDDFVDVQGHQRSTRIVVERLRDDATTRATLVWGAPLAVDPPPRPRLATLRGPSLLPHGP